MAKDGSVAPKERVNIVYKPATGDVKAEVELPNKLLVLGDFTQRNDERMVENRDPISVDKDNFNEVLKAQNVSLDLAVPDELSGSDDPDARFSVHLDFASIKDFEPDSVAAAVPELAKLLQVREALKALKGPLANVPDFRKKLQEIIKDEAARDRLLEALDLKK